MVLQAHPQQAPRPTVERPVLRPAEAKRRPATLHFFTYVVGNALAWILWCAISISTDNWYWWPVVPLAGWTLVLALRLRHVYRSSQTQAMADTEPATRAEGATFSSSSTSRVRTYAGSRSGPHQRR